MQKRLLSIVCVCILYQPAELLLENRASFIIIKLSTQSYKPLDRASYHSYHTYWGQQ